MKRFSIIISVLALSVGSVLVLHEAKAQVACTPATEAADCGSGLYCIGPTGEQRCNVPPPIWNAEVFGATQDASFNVQHNSTVVGNLTVGSTTGGGSGDLRVNAIYSRLGQDAADEIWLGGTNNTLRIQGSLLVDDDLRVGGNDVLTSITSSDTSGLTVGGTGSGRTVRLNDCLANQILKRNAAGNAWICETDLVGTDGEGTTDHGALTGLADNDHPRYYLQTGDTRNLGVGGSLTVGGLLQTTGFQLGAMAAAGSVLTANASGVGTWQALPPGVLPSGTAGQTLRHNGTSWIANSILSNNGTNVGIRTDNPAYGLDVQGTGVQGQVRAQAGFCIGTDCITSWPAGGTGGGVSGTGVANKLAFWTGANTLGQNTNLHWDSTNNRLGIGGSSPEEKLEVRDDTTGAARLRIADPVQNPELQLQFGSAGNHWSMYVDQSEAGAKALRFWSPAAPAGNRVTITADGRVGIGTDNPRALLDVFGQRMRFNDVLMGEKIDGLNVIQPIGGGLRVSAAGRPGLVVSASDRVGVGTTTPEFTLDVSGDRMIVRNPGGNAELDLRSGTAGPWGIYADQVSGDLRFWNGDNRFFFSSAGDLVASHSINVSNSGCFGPVFVGTTAAPGSQGSVGGYTGANALCNAPAAFPGSHVCFTEEILESIKCGNTAVLAAPGFAWISNGPLAFTAQANDCRGWTNNTTAFGAMWEFGATGGRGHLTGCNTTRVFACCR